MDIGDVRSKFEAFGWDAVEIDGHDMAAVVEALEWSRGPRAPGGDRLPDPQGLGRVADGGPVRLPRQAADARAGRAGADRARGKAGRAGRRAGAVAVTPHARQGPGRDAHGVRRCAGRAGRAPRRRRGARRRPGGVDAEHQVRPQVPRALLQRRRGGGQHDVDGLWPGGHRQGAVRVDVRDLRHRPRLRPGAARHRPQRAAGAGVRLARRAVARRGRRLAPDDRGHRPDARDAADAGDRAGRLQPGLPRRAREL